MTETAILEQRVVDIKAKISRLEQRLTKAEAALHQRRLEELGWLGLTARSDRVPQGVTIIDVTFKTWAPTEPQAVIGETRTIPVTSPGFQIHDSNRKSSAA